VADAFVAVDKRVVLNQSIAESGGLLGQRGVEVGSPKGLPGQGESRLESGKADEARTPSKCR
jgi:hypothetical protein